jgi:hypothetical protein
MCGYAPCEVVSVLHASLTISADVMIGVLI